MSMAAQANCTRHRFAYGDEVIDFDLRRQHARHTTHIAIHVEPNGLVLVDAPVAAALADVMVAVKKRARWISKRIDAAKARLKHVLPCEYVSGESLHYLGRRYQLKVVVDLACPVQAQMRGAFITVTVPTREVVTIRSALATWYRLRAKEVFARRLAVIAGPLPWVEELPPLRFQFMSRQWGSCSPTGRITLNPWLVRAPREAIDYVVLHEVCHLRHHNHSRAFYSTLDRYMPNWRAVKQQLDSRAEDYLRS